MDVAQSLFEEFLAHGIDRIERIVTESESEGSFLEFKSSRTESGALTKEDRKNLGKSLSAFSNSLGGVVVWGINAKNLDDQNPVRTAESRAPIPNIKRFVEDVNAQVGQLLLPHAQGVLVHEVLEDDNSGYVAMYIPQSHRKPHMSMASEDTRYYLRSGSQTIRMDHTMVHALMFAEEAPRFEIRSKVHKVDPIKSGTRKDLDFYGNWFWYSATVILYLRNVGKVYGEDCGFLIEKTDGLRISQTATPVSSINEDGTSTPALQGHSAMRLIFPTAEFELVTVFFPFKARIWAGSYEPISKMSFNVLIFARGASDSKSVEVDVSGHYPFDS